MSRSKHTDPRSIRAARRLRAPFEGRSADDASLRRRIGKAVAESGAAPVPKAEGKMQRRHGLRIVTERARQGFHHPANKAQVLAILKAVGPVACYGLRTIEFLRRPRDRNSNVPSFGRYKVPGRIVLFEQPLSPWRLPGLLEGDNVSRFERAGALIKPLAGPQATLVEWPEGTLPRFMLEEVLLHELGHHVLQHEKGKRLVRIARTQDHEAFAARFAVRQRLMLRAKGRLVW